MRALAVPQRVMVPAVATVAVAAACWLVAVRRMEGMDMGGETELGSLASFLLLWATMMAAMMLPGVVPAMSRAAAAGRAFLAPAFAASYLAIWIAAGVAVYAAYAPHGSNVAGALTLAAAVYELTPLKRACRRRCREPVRSGTALGLYCVGSSAGLMLVLLALGVMDVALMGAVAALVLAQKLLPENPLIDLPVALGLAGLGLLTLV
jgi:predicted metal-binding membrane protein